ncbi:hypothetical protein KL86DES1_20695 [uncultured Desulfovibrio sp.]|uniref:Uncharacterized protein n=1 Tax=uncultured Desulfovibrio sp. TaxID=167968 RepID=A0A212L4V5_9BACT|nr:hypothetical protein KL86DES1_20695 [uncultured Desulfovibrio sp.]
MMGQKRTPGLSSDLIWRMLCRNEERLISAHTGLSKLTTTSSRSGHSNIHCCQYQHMGMATHVKHYLWTRDTIYSKNKPFMHSYFSIFNPLKNASPYGKTFSEKIHLLLFFLLNL